MPGGLIPVLGGIWEEPTPQRYSVIGGEGELVSGDPAGIKILDCSSPLYTMYNEATDRTWHGKMDWFQIGKGVQGCILSPCFFNLYAEYIMRNAGLDEAQAAIKIARRNINYLRYADDTTLMAVNEEELKSLLMKVKEESEKAGLKLNSQ